MRLLRTGIVNNRELVVVVTYMYSCQQIIEVFNRTFLSSHNTRLVGGGEEPLYLPAHSGDSARIIFRADYFSSALHEISHWCIAGEARRLQEDYGYWYAPDGRTERQQIEFERVEIKPQALEWILNVACGHPFAVSADNLMAGLGASVTFKKAISDQAKRYCDKGLNVRAKTFVKALTHSYKTASVLDASFYTVSRL